MLLVDWVQLGYSSAPHNVGYGYSLAEIHMGWIIKMTESDNW